MRSKKKKLPDVLSLFLEHAGKLLDGTFRFRYSTYIGG